jgi:putative tricarboxylic transport membrane protein
VKKFDFIPGVIFSVLGIAVALGSWHLKLGSFEDPGGGLVPFLISLFLILLSGIVLAASHDVRGALQEIRGIWSEVPCWKLALVVIYITGYAFFLEIIGYILATLIFFLILLKTISLLTWKTTVITSLLTVFLSYIMFAILLKVQLPSGIWGIG